MTDKDFILQSDVAATVLCGISKVIAPIAVETGVFSLSNPADLMQTVVALGDKHGIYIVPEFKHIGDEVISTSWWEADGPKSFYVEACDTYTEAIRHAVMALKENK